MGIVAAPIFKYFLSYSGVKLPLNLVSPIGADALENRNTYFRAGYDADGRMITCEKIVYGEVELRHGYHYRADGRLAHAHIDMAGDETEILFDENGVGAARSL
ncbi:DUF6156 family protein [Methylocystis sp. IM3]|uniref:DUF6156 family protein n=1 Tax=unclassified Methylocystis TaxID=2625913 RepID=UPI0030F4FFD6